MITKLSFFISIILCLNFVQSIDYPLYIGATPFEPMMRCSIGTLQTLKEISQANNKAGFSGYDLDLLIRVIEILEWDLTKIYLKCLSSNDFYNQVYFRSLFFGIGGIPITAQNVIWGFSYSLPTYSSGLKLLIQTQIEQNYWSFLKTFDVLLWIMIIVTTFITGIITWLFEDQTFSCKYDQQCKMNFKEMIWQAFSSLFFTSEIRLQKFSARIVFLCFWFMVLIWTATYTANLTSQLSLNIQNQPIRSLIEAQNAANLLIFTYKEYGTTFFSPLEFKGKFMYYDKTAEGTSNLLAAFKDDKIGTNNIKAILIDSPLADSLTSRWPCTTYVLDQTVSNFNYGFIFKDPPNYEINRINTALFFFKESSELSILTKKYIKISSQESSCDTEKRMTINKLAGLWVIIAGAVLIGSLIEVLNYFIRKHRLKKISVITSSKNIDYSYDTPKVQMENYLMITDYIHIPSKNLHLLVENDIKDNVAEIERTLKEKIRDVEKKVANFIGNLDKNMNENNGISDRYQKKQL